MTTIPTLPDPPSRADPSTFSTKADAHLAALPGWTTAVNTVAGEIETNKDAAEQAVADCGVLKADVTALKSDVINLKNETIGYKDDAEAAVADAEYFAQMALLSPGTSATSATSLSISTGTKNFVIQTGKAFTVGQFVSITCTTDVTKYMVGRIYSYNSSTGDISVNVSYFQGNGTFTAWTIALSAPLVVTRGEVFVADGTIPVTSPVVLNADGTVSAVNYVSPVYGEETVFESASVSYISTCSVSPSVFVVCYSDVGNSNYGTAVVGTVSGTSISFGTPVVFESASTNFISCSFDSTNSKVVVCYSDAGNSNYGTAVVGTVSGTSISFGTPVVYRTGAVSSVSTCFDSANSKIVEVHQEGSSGMYYHIGTVSGTSISFTSAALVPGATGANTFTTCCYDIFDSKVIMAHSSSTIGRVLVGSSNGTTITFGTAQTFNAAVATYIQLCPIAGTSKISILYSDAGNSNYGTAVVGTVSGTSISVGQEVVFNSSGTTFIGASFDSNANKLIVAYTVGGVAAQVQAAAVDTSHAFIADSKVEFNSGNTTYISCLYNQSSTGTIISYTDVSNSSYGTSKLNILATETNADRFIGYSQNQEVMNDGDYVRVHLLGNLDSNRTGLTTNSNYYIDYYGNLTTGVTEQGVAGRAVSSTSILITRGFK